MYQQTRADQLPWHHQWWRWPLVLPAAAIGGALGAFILTAMQWFALKMQGGFSQDGWYFLYVLPLLSSVAFGWLYTYIAWQVAPKGKAVTGIVLVTLLGIASAFSIFLVWWVLDYPTGQAVQTTLACIANTVASIFSLVGLMSEHR